MLGLGLIPFKLTLTIGPLDTVDLVLISAPWNKSAIINSFISKIEERERERERER